MKYLIIIIFLLPGCTFNVQIDHELSSQSGRNEIEEKKDTEAKQKADADLNLSNGL